MTLSKTLFLSFAVLSLTACQTTSAVSPSQTLLADIDTTVISQAGTANPLSGNNPTCLKFYQNTSAYVSMPTEVKSGPSIGGSILKTVVLGTLAGVAGGGVAAMGIESAFVEAAVVSTASQVTYNAGDTVYDKIVGTKTPDPTVPAVDPMQEIEKAAAVLGCPAPDQASIQALNLGAEN